MEKTFILFIFLIIISLFIDDVLTMLIIWIIISGLLGTLTAEIQNIKR